MLQYGTAHYPTYMIVPISCYLHCLVYRLHQG